MVTRRELEPSLKHTVSGLSGAVDETLKTGTLRTEKYKYVESPAVCFRPHSNPTSSPKLSMSSPPVPGTGPAKAMGNGKQKGWPPACCDVSADRLT